MAMCVSTHQKSVPQTHPDATVTKHLHQDSVAAEERWWLTSAAGKEAEVDAAPVWDL